ncbi:MAG: M20/M25/M40 family metallo-hydrolase [Bacteroidetes bacterium]|nr:M20/M25/M40 family metallo-hydrolase [Bacteroidota bacterium]
MRSKQINIVILFLSITIVSVSGQKKGLNTINSHDLKMHMEFLASDELEGRNTGEQGLQVAARYLGVQAQQLGLEQADAGKGYFQYYTIEEKSYDRENCHITISRAGQPDLVNRDTFYMLSLGGEDHVSLEGEVVFAGYGITSEEKNYNDLADIDISGKIVLIMNGAPWDEGGNSFRGMQVKMAALYENMPKTVLIVQDPKSGYNSVEEAIPGIANSMGRSRRMKGENSGSRFKRNPSIVFINTRVADQLLAGSGENLKDLQMEIEKSLTPKSFALDSVDIRIEMNMQVKDIVVSNVFGLIEGSDPELKDEVVIYVAHYDHVGTDGNGGVYNGADDNASGTVALIEIAEAFMKEKKRPARSVGILWVSAEEIGLFGSKYFSDHPLVPKQKIAAVINLDMVGRTKNNEDDLNGHDGLTIVGGDTVKVIGGLQSKVLMEINRESLEEMEMVGNYEFNDLSHPERYFYRSDHINFARKDIPVLYYSTGTHKDYHKVTDELKLIDYDKFLKMTRLSYKAGYNVADYGEPIEVDNPMSTW